MRAHSPPGRAEARSTPPAAGSPEPSEWPRRIPHHGRPRRRPRMGSPRSGCRGRSPGRGSQGCRPEASRDGLAATPETGRGNRFLTEGTCPMRRYLYRSPLPPRIEAWPRRTTERVPGPAAGACRHSHATGTSAVRRGPASPPLLKKGTFWNWTKGTLWLWANTPTRRFLSSNQGNPIMDGLTGAVFRDCLLLLRRHQRAVIRQ